FQEGTYRFQYTTDDGMRIYVDGTLVADRWGDPQVITDSFERFMTPGTHLIEVVWYQATGGAHAAISWAPVGGPPRPPAPTGLSAAGGTNEIGLGWIASTGTGITGYNVYRRPLSGSYTSIGCQFTDATHCRDTGLPAATDFCYQVTAVNAGGESDRSNEACARTNDGPPPACPNDPLALPDNQWRLEIFNVRADVNGATVERRYQFPGDNGFDLTGGAPSSCV